MIIVDRLMKQIQQAIRDQGKTGYFVGGGVRDLLLENRERIQDLDFVIQGDPKPLMDGLREILGGTLVEMEKKVPLTRLVLKDGLMLDFMEMQGKTIEEDLKGRDFTICAMAYPLDGPWPMKEDLLIDPYGGLKDLRRNLIRMTSGDVFDEDPLRLIRAPRLMAQLGLDLDNDTARMIREKSHLIRKAAGERLNRELFLILKEKRSHYYLSYMDRKLDLINKLFPEIDCMKDIGECKYHVVDSWTHSIYTVKVAESIIYAHGFFEDHIRENYERHAEEKITKDHKRLELIKLGALFHDIGKPSAKKVDTTGRTRFRGHEITGAELVKEYGEQLKMSRREIEILYKYVSLHMIPLVLYKKNDVSGKALYNFFEEAGKETLDLLLIALSDIVSTRKLLEPTEEMGMFKIHVEYIANNYITRYRPIEDISKVISGKEVMDAVKLPEGAFVGQVLEDIKKAMFYGHIPQSKEGAHRYLKQYFRENEEK